MQIGGLFKSKAKFPPNGKNKGERIKACYVFHKVSYPPFCEMLVVIDGDFVFSVLVRQEISSLV